MAVNEVADTVEARITDSTVRTASSVSVTTTDESKITSDAGGVGLAGAGGGAVGWRSGSG